MRKAIDLILTINLFGIIVFGAYLWYTGTLIIAFEEPQTAAVVEHNVVQAFATTLKMEVDHKRGVPENGYEPQMFLEVFPGLVQTDFTDVETTLGAYDIVHGQLVHNIPPATPRHSAAKAITTRGMETLLENVSARTAINLAKDGTITELMAAISN